MAGHAVAVMVGGVVAADCNVPAGEFLAERASQIGETWVHDYVRELRSQARAPVGAWPGTMTVARGRVVVQLAIVLAPARLDELARVAMRAARRGWQAVCEADNEE